MTEPVETAIDWEAFSDRRTRLGIHFVRIFGYFREDGQRAVDALERAMQAEDAVHMIEPALRLNEDACLFGAQALALSAERIEIGARQCVEWRASPTELLKEIGGLRRLFEETLKVLTAASDPIRRRA